MNRRAESVARELAVDMKVNLASIVRMSNPIKVLFVCSQNKWRSLTAEKIYAGFPGYSVRSAGTEEKARIKVTRCHIGWADVIICMEKKHVDRLHGKFHDVLSGKRLVCLNIADDYEYMDPELVELLTAKLSEHIDVPE